MILVHRKKSPEKTAFEQCEILPNINECEFSQQKSIFFAGEGAQGQRLVTYTDYNYELDLRCFETRRCTKKQSLENHKV